MEMEGGPYLSAAYEITEPKRHPTNEIVSLVDHTSRDARARRHPLRVGYAVLAAPEPAVEVAVVLRHGEHVRLRDRDRAADLDERAREARVSGRRADVVCIGAGVVGLGFANWWRERASERARGRARARDRARRLLPHRRARRLRVGLLGALLSLQAPRDRAWLRDRMPGEDVRTVERVAKIRYAGRDIDFPFQKHIHQLPLDEFLECLTELYFRPQAARRARSARCCTQRLGKGITDKFLRPYNEKLYATDLDTLDVDAMGRFFPHADIADIIANMRPGARAHGYNATFTYPAGGAIHYIHALLRDLPAGTVACGEPVDRDRSRRAHRARRRSARSQYRPRRQLGAAAGARALCGVAHDADVFTSNQVLVFNLGFDAQGPRRRPLDVLPGPRRRRSIASVGTTTSSSGRSDEPLRRDRGARTARAFDVDALRARVLADLRREGIVTTTSSSRITTSCSIRRTSTSRSASLAETARLRGAARGARRPLGRPLRRLDLLLDRGQPLETRELASARSLAQTQRALVRRDPDHDEALRAAREDVDHLAVGHRHRRPLLRHHRVGELGQAEERRRRRPRATRRARRRATRSRRACRRRRSSPSSGAPAGSVHGAAVVGADQERLLRIERAQERGVGRAAEHARRTGSRASRRLAAAEREDAGAGRDPRAVASSRHGRADRVVAERSTHRLVGAGLDELGRATCLSSRHDDRDAAIDIERGAARRVVAIGAFESGDRAVRASPASTCATTSCLSVL